MHSLKNLPGRQIPLADTVSARGFTVSPRSLVTCFPKDILACGSSCSPRLPMLLRKPPTCSTVTMCGFCPHLQRRVRPGFSPGSLFKKADCQFMRYLYMPAGVKSKILYSTGNMAWQSWEKVNTNYLGKRIKAVAKSRFRGVYLSFADGSV